MQTRRAVLDAAIARFGREGYRATSVADVARDAGVGGTVPYAYFPGKEALFLAAIDEDAARLIDEVVPAAMAEPIPDWPQRLIQAAVEALGQRPLARRILAGLEPEVTGRVLEVPALAELRKTAAERLRTDQAAGRTRPDIDPVATGSGIVTIMLSLLMSVVQVGFEATATYGGGVAAVIEAATALSPRPTRPEPQ
ncbi:MAG TPA: TetR/AcrR family transcriptional regulator [Acidimicrobiales bacterium]|nr:TetR/AcrR family transcriptional regulator [Acidimicrobiales bacterium]